MGEYGKSAYHSLVPSVKHVGEELEGFRLARERWGPAYGDETRGLWKNDADAARWLRYSGRFDASRREHWNKLGSAAVVCMLDWGESGAVCCG